MNQDHAEIVMVWAAMIARCHHPKNPQYSDYGGRGIYVCERWHDFRLFCEDMAPRPKGMSVDRRDNNAGYSPDNCRWANKQQQAANRRNNVNIVIDGVTRGVAEWSRLSGTNDETIVYRHRHGWSGHDAVFGKDGRFTKNGKPCRRYDHDGKSLTIREWSKWTGIAECRIEQRLEAGWTIERTLTFPVSKSRKPLAPDLHRST